MVQDKAVASPQFTPPRNAGQGCQKQRVCGRSSARFVGYDDDIIFTPPLPILALPERERLRNTGFRCPIDGITPDF